MKQLIKRILTRLFGIKSFSFVWQPLALCYYKKKLRTNDHYQQWLKTHHDWIATHWGHPEDVVETEFMHAHLSSQLYEITEMLRKRMGPLENAKVLDAGASDGMFLSLLGVRDGTGMNILPSCVEKIRSAGFQGIQCDIETTPFKDKEFDYVICCETLEHVLNPIRTLNELSRICRKKIFLTIPWLPQTRLNRKPEGWPNVESHVFEFSRPDFQKIITFSDVRSVYEDWVHVFPEPFNPLSRWWLSQLMYPSYFPKLQFYELEPIR